MFYELFETSSLGHFYNGCVIAELRNYRGYYTSPDHCDRSYLLLQPPAEVRGTHTETYTYRYIHAQSNLVSEYSWGPSKLLLINSSTCQPYRLVLWVISWGIISLYFLTRYYSLTVFFLTRFYCMYIYVRTYRSMYVLCMCIQYNLSIMII